jgi:hypothetical protein
MFGRLHEWLDRRISDSASFGFYRPYDLDRSGVAPERWHLSFWPMAARFEQQLTMNLLGETIREADISLKEVILDNLDEIYARFVMNTARPPR